MSKKTLHTGIAVVVTVGIVGLFFILGLPFSTDSFQPSFVAEDQAAMAAAAQEQVITQDVTQGSGPMAKAGDTVTVDYTGKLGDGTTFDTSVGKQPYTFVLGASNIIDGWNQGLVGAQAGTRRLILVPPSLGYGPVPNGPIPANSALLFDVTVISVTSAQ